MSHPDEDLGKGAVEGDKPNDPSQTSMKSQLPHRPVDDRIDGYDCDFPEPGENPEHSGQAQDPGFRQKTNQNDKKDDPLAA